MHLRTKPNVSSMYMYILFEDIKIFKLHLFSLYVHTHVRGQLAVVIISFHHTGLKIKLSLLGLAANTLTH